MQAFYYTREPEQREEAMVFLEALREVGEGYLQAQRLLVIDEIFLNKSIV